MRTARWVPVSYFHILTSGHTGVERTRENVARVAEKIGRPREDMNGHVNREVHSQTTRDPI